MMPEYKKVLDKLVFLSRFEASRENGSARLRFCFETPAPFVALYDNGLRHISSPFRFYAEISKPSGLNTFRWI